MNIHKLFEVVETEEMSSPLITIIFGLEQHGYRVKLEGVEVTAENMYDNIFDDFEKATNNFEIEMMKNSEPLQKFLLEFTDFHKFNFKAC